MFWRATDPFASMGAEQGNPLVRQQSHRAGQLRFSGRHYKNNSEISNNSPAETDFLTFCFALRQDWHLYCLVKVRGNRDWCLVNGRCVSIERGPLTISAALKKVEYVCLQSSGLMLLRSLDFQSGIVQLNTLYLASGYAVHRERFNSLGDTNALMETMPEILQTKGMTSSQMSWTSYSSNGALSECG